MSGDILWKQLKSEVFGTLDWSRDLGEEELICMIEQRVSQYAKEHLLSLSQRQLYEKQIYNSFRKLDILQELIDDDEITEIMVNGPSNIFYEKKGRLFPWTGGSFTEEKLADLIQQIVGRANRTVNEAQPIVDARLSDGSRVNVVLSPISLGGSCISIRKFPKNPMTLERLIELGSISVEIADFLKLLVEAKYNIFVAGGTGSGKTTFLNALSRCIPGNQRIVTIEDSAELQMEHIPNLVRLEARESNGSGGTAISIRDLIKTALRMRPDRIIVGEVRGAEALDMVQATLSGHDGSFSSGHSNSCTDMLSRLETMIMMADMALPLEAIRRQIASGVDIIIHLGRLRDQSRKVLQIVEVQGIFNGEIQLNTLFEYQETGESREGIFGEWKREGVLKHRQKLAMEGLEKAFERWEDHSQ